MKNRAQLDSDVWELIKYKNMDKVKSILVRHFRVNAFEKLDSAQLVRAIEIIKDALYKGEV